ncbi:MAG: hypothetical protein ACOX3D_08955 [Syntrophomonadales bacterium]
MKQFIVLAVVGVMLFVGGCAGETQDEVIPNIGGIHLGDTRTQVTDILGSDYEEIFEEEGGHFGEPYYILDYREGIKLIIGQDSGKVMQIDVTTPGMATDMGVNVGDQAADAIAKYREKYSEPESIHSGEKLVGWFEVGEGALVILDVDRNDDTIVNPEITPDMEVEMIRLVYSRYID